MPDPVQEQAPAPGTVVPTGVVVTPSGPIGSTGVAGAAGPAGPAGAAGVSGLPAYNNTTTQFTVPAVGSTATVTLVDASWCEVGAFVYVAGAGGSGQAGALQITAIAGNTLTLLNPPATPTIPLASTAGPGLLAQLNGNASQYVGGDNALHVIPISGPSANAGNLITTGTDSLLYLPPSAIQPTIWSARLRAFNAIHNPGFEVDQRNVNNALAYFAGNITNLQCDRWQVTKNAATGVIQAQNVLNTYPYAIIDPRAGNFNISKGYLFAYVGTTQATLAAGESITIQQFVEGPQFRELSFDVHSVSFYCYSATAINISVYIRDSNNARSIVFPYSIPSQVWTLVTLPNIPVWPSGGGLGFTYAPGSISYNIGICLGCGTTYQTSTTGQWVSGNFLGTPTTSNFLGNASNQFQVNFFQHEPGPLCTYFQDKPFTQNLFECQRFYAKSTNYNSKFPAAGAIMLGTWAGGTTGIRPCVSFPVSMAKPPAVTVCDNNGNSNQVYIDGVTTNVQPVSSTTATTAGIYSITLTSTPTGQASPYTQNPASGHWQADTGW